jgi:predicted nucleic acid-binding protein
MIGLDTNVVLRYLLQDDPKQAHQANQIVDRQLSEQNPGFINLVAVLKIVWAIMCERNWARGKFGISSAASKTVSSPDGSVENHPTQLPAHPTQPDFSRIVIGRAVAYRIDPRLR